MNITTLQSVLQPSFSHQLCYLYVSHAGNQWCKTYGFTGKRAEEIVGPKNVYRETVNVDDARKRTIQHWKQEWNTCTNGRYERQNFSQILPAVWRVNLKRLLSIWHNCYRDTVISVSTCLGWRR